MPVSEGGSAEGEGGRSRKLSKIGTLLYAKNYILLLTSSVAQLRRRLAELQGGDVEAEAAPHDDQEQTMPDEHPKIQSSS